MLIRCARNTSPDCRYAAELPEEELLGDGGGDPSLLVIDRPRKGWIGNPDGDGHICDVCATPDEIQTFEGNAEEVDPADVALDVWGLPDADDNDVLEARPPLDVSRTLDTWQHAPSLQ